MHVGGGAFALPRYVAATRPRSRQDVLELDPGVVALAREHLGLRLSPRLRVRIGDAAALLPARPDRSADLVIGDAFDGPDVPAAAGDARSSPPHVRRVLRPGGVYALNVIDVPPLDVARAHAADARGRVRPRRGDRAARRAAGRRARQRRAASPPARRCR